MRECTHQPRINALSRSIVTETHSQRQPPPAQTPTLTSSLVHPHPLPQYTPKQSLSRCSSVFEKLHENRKGSDCRQGLREQLHRPSINQISKEIVGESKFSQRQVKYQQAREEKKQQLKQSLQSEK